MSCVKSEIVPTSHGRHLVYAGAPAQKDLILPYLIAIKDINNDQVKVVADIVGVTKEQVKTLLQIDDPEKIGIIAYGRVPHEECVKVIEKADFSILFRENLRYAKAGFSTKLCGLQHRQFQSGEPAGLRTDFVRRTGSRRCAACGL